MSDDAAVHVELRNDGPIVITGPVTLDDGTEVAPHDRLFLCRCGASNTKPRCDGTHRTNGFTAPGVVPPIR